MKIIRILGHPYTVVILFSLLLISGESFGGVYALYILLALPHGGVYALLAVAGIILLAMGHHFRSRALTETILNTIGLIFLVTSLFIFFAADSSHYNAGTFEQAVPVVSFCFFGLAVLCSLLVHGVRLAGRWR